MRFLCNRVSIRFLSCVDNGKSISLKSWRSYKMFRRSNVQQNILLPRGDKSTEILNSGLACEMNRRCSHIGTRKVLELIKDENIRHPNLFDWFMVPLLYYYIILRLDRNFKQFDFKQGAGQALHYITKNLVNGNVSALSEITTPDCLDKLVKNTERLSNEGKSLLLINPDNNYGIKIGRIKFENLNNGSDNQLIALKIMFLCISANLNYNSGRLQYIELQRYFTEFKRIYGEKGKSPWIVSGIKMIYEQIHL